VRRRLDAVFLLDKPAGITSNAALQAARRLYAAEKAGHAGTLDPLASGLLPVLFGEAAKFAGRLLDADKEYVAEVRLGAVTATGDAEGEIVESGPVTVGDDALRAVLARFIGPVVQVPPMYSALKHEGTPLYKLARKGIEVERAPRTVEVRELELLHRRGELIELRVSCSKGTYIRTLAADIGTALGTGAFLAGLRRTATSGFRIEAATTLEALEALPPSERDRRLLGIEALLADLPETRLDAGMAKRFSQGQVLALEAGLVRPGSRRVYAPDGGLIGLGELAADGTLRAVRLRAQRAEPAQAAEKHQKNL
jgi:tRNA pseudouridine55 synthase